MHSIRMIKKIVTIVAMLLALELPAMAQFGTELVYYELNKPKRNLAPLGFDDIRAIRMGELMFDALYGWNDRGEVDPQLAQGLPTLLDDSTRALVILKNNLLWPDSLPITVDDVIFTYTLKKNFANIKDMRRGLELIKEIRPGEAPNSILFKFARKVQYPERLLANIFIMPRHKILDQKAFDVYSEMPMGAGPFQLREISIKTNSYNLYKNFNYGSVAPGRPYIDRVKMTYWTSKAIWPVNILQGGIVHVLPDMEYNTELATKSQINSIPVNTNTVPMILFNSKDPILKNTFVRQGLQHLIPRNQIYETIYMQDTTNVLTGPYPPSSYFYNYTIPAWDYNTNQAYGLFEQSGLLSVKNGKVYRTDTGAQWDLVLVTYITAAGEEENLRKALESVNNYFISSGINSKIEYRSSEGYVRALEMGTFQLIYMKITLDDNFNIEPFFSTEAISRPGGQNFGRYSNPEVDRAFREMLMTPVPQKQRALGLAIHKVLHDDPPAMFLWNLHKYAYCRSELQDVSIDPFYFFSTADRWNEKTD
jgi:peptide/nickel transport system substrate-binding protein